MDRTSGYIPVSFYRIMNINCYGIFFLRKVYLYGVELPRLGHTMFFLKTRLGFPSVVEYSIRHDKRACDQHHNQFLHGLDQGTGAQVRGLLHGLVHAADTGRDSVAGLLPESPVR